MAILIVFRESNATNFEGKPVRLKDSLYTAGALGLVALLANSQEDKYSCHPNGFSSIFLMRLVFTHPRPVFFP